MRREGDIGLLPSVTHSAEQRQVNRKSLCRLPDVALVDAVGGRGLDLES